MSGSENKKKSKSKTKGTWSPLARAISLENRATAREEAPPDPAPETIALGRDEIIAQLESATTSQEPPSPEAIAFAEEVMAIQQQESAPEPPPIEPQPQSQPPHSPQHWRYPTPLEPLEEPHFLYDRVIEINGMPFQRRSDCNYKHSYYQFVDMIAEYKALPPEWHKKPANRLLNEWNLYRNMIQRDLWFFVYFVMKNSLANHPFIVEACKEIEDEVNDTLEVWARDHLKTTIISTARTCQKILIDPEKRIGIFSAVRPLAVKIQNLIKNVLESPFLVRCFPDILYADPKREAPKWTEDPAGGLIVKRKGFYKEATVSSWGLVEGMPVGDHYTDLVMDDIVNQDLQSPEIMQKVCDNFDMAENIGTRDRQITVVGTFYRHDDPLVYIMNKRDVETGEPMFKLRKKTATIDGTFTGKSAFLPEKTLKKKRSGKIYFFMCQQLLDPTPRGHEKLNRDHLIKVKRSELPSRLYKFMLIDGAGDLGRRLDRTADAWAMMVIGVEPYRDAEGNNRIYILDMLIEDMDLLRAQKEAVDMYCRNGRIIKLAIEKVAMSTTEIHICAALRAKKRFLSIDMGNLEILKPGGRSKQFRIESALSWPLKNGKIHIVDTIAPAYSERLGMEMEKFPAWKDDGLDALSYVYDIIKTYRFGALPEDEKPETPYDAAFRRAKERAFKGGWIAV